MNTPSTVHVHAQQGMQDQRFSQDQNQCNVRCNGEQNEKKKKKK
jgi:hypothetical protein